MYFQTYSSIVAKNEGEQRVLSFGRIQPGSYHGQAEGAGLADLFAALRNAARKYLRMF